MKQRRYITTMAILLSAISINARGAVVIDNSYSGSIINTFAGLPSGNVPGLIAQPGADYGELFSGQVLATGGGFDALSGTPNNPLTLLPNPIITDNVGILFFGSEVVVGDLNSQIGEGALSTLLHLDSDGIGFNIVGVNGGGAFTAQFFARNGTLLGTITQALNTNGHFGFRVMSGECIAGVSLTNIDPAGIAYDNVTFDQCSAVPEPASLSLALLALGLGRVAFISRARRMKSALNSANRGRPTQHALRRVGTRFKWANQYSAIGARQSPRGNSEPPFGRVRPRISALNWLGL